MKRKNILAIGNSFSQDAVYYLHEVAKAGGVNVKIVNLYIGGCPLEKHWQNIESGESAYEYELNGRAAGRIVSVRDAVNEEKWDYIITQQASHDSGWQDTYSPFLGLIKNYINTSAPEAELLLHQTWAYETDSTHNSFIRYNRSQKEMYERLGRAYKKAAEEHGLRLIPSGDMIQKMRKIEPFVYENGGMSLCRDGFHMSYIYGRYIIAAVWAKFLLNINMTENDYVPETDLAPLETADINVVDIIKKNVDEFIK